MAKDYYQILGISKNASQDEIKKSFRELAHKYHPDKAGGDEKRFKEINEAYQVLSNPEKRQQYDQYGQTFEQAQAQGGFSGFNGYRDFSGFADAFRSAGGNGSSFEFDFGNIGDIFGDFFGGGSKTTTKTRARRGSDMEMELTLTFREAIFGVEKEIEFSKHTVCERCKGAGSEPGSEIVRCPACGGKGTVVKTLGFGIGVSSTCPECQGVGERYEKVCSECRGEGKIRARKTLVVTIPAGINNGESIRLRGEGEAGTRGAKSGDLYIRVRVIQDPKFQRDGFTIKTREYISFSQAALGAKIPVETVDGIVELKIPEGVQGGTVLHLRGKGVPHIQGRGRGDHVVEIIVKTPTRLTKKQRKILEEFEKE